MLNNITESGYNSTMNFESSHAIHLAEDIDHNIKALLDGPASDNYMRRQTQLVVEKFVTEHPDATLNHATLSRAMMEWATTDSRDGFSKIANSPEFKDHPRFMGSVANITLEDVRHYIETKTIPE